MFLNIHNRIADVAMSGFLESTHSRISGCSKSCQRQLKREPKTPPRDSPLLLSWCWQKWVGLTVRALLTEDETSVLSRRATTGSRGKGRMGLTSARRCWPSNQHCYPNLLPRGCTLWRAPLKRPGAEALSFQCSFYPIRHR